MCWVQEGFREAWQVTTKVALTCDDERLRPEGCECDSARGFLHLIQKQFIHLQKDVTDRSADRRLLYQESSASRYAIKQAFLLGRKMISKLFTSER